MLGFFTGFNLCPPFLLSIAYVFDQGSMVKGICFFLIFFIVTSLYFLPFIFAGILSKFNKIKEAARLTGILSGAVFLWIGLIKLLSLYQL